MYQAKRILSLILCASLLLGLCLNIALPALGLTMGDRPADSTTVNAPFPQGTAGSNSFRIPVLVTLSDGTLLAAADARWDTTYDGGGLDTVVARSTNGGASWSYTFANYLGDNGNKYNGSSTCFIDPSLAVDADDTVYMLCDLYPYGVALNGSKETGPSYELGFDDDGLLRLSANDHGSYDYRLQGEQIIDASGNAVAGYRVDAWFNLYQDGVQISNLFYSDSPYKVPRTGYLYLTHSTDKGKTWSTPTLLDLKTDQEQVCLVGPNGGHVTKSGTIVFPVYSYADGEEHTALIYSTDGGQNWIRSKAIDYLNCSEADVVELGNGNLRCFFRNQTGTLRYADFDLATGTWGSMVDTQLAVNSNTALSAISCKGTVNGNQVILVSCPTGPNAAGSGNSNGAYRTSGKIFAGIVLPDGTMSWKPGLEVTPVASSALSGSNYTAAQGFFAYSSLAELSDGSVAILYEDNQFGWGSGTGYGYTTAFKTYSRSALESAFGILFDSLDPDGKLVVNVALDVGETKEFTDESGDHSEAAGTVYPNSEIADMTLEAFGSVSQTTVSTEKATELEPGATYLLRVHDTAYALTSQPGRNDWGTSTLAFKNWNSAATAENMWLLEAADGGYKLKSAAGYLNLTNVNNVGKVGTTGEVFTLTYTSTGWTVRNPYGKYINALGGLTSYYSAGGWTGDGTRFDLYKVSFPENDSTRITFTGVAPGTTTAVVGNSLYNITVFRADQKDTITSGGSGIAYILNTDGVIDPTGEYLIVNTGSNGTAYALKNNGGKVATQTVTIDNGTIAPDQTDGLLWTLSDGKIANGGYYVEGYNQSLALIKSVSQNYTFVPATDGSCKLYITDGYWWDYLYWTGTAWASEYTSKIAQVPSVYLFEKVEASSWTVDPARQQVRYNAAVGLIKDDYTDTSWNIYEHARTQTLHLLSKVGNETYATEAAAQAALDRLIDAVDALEQAAAALIPAKTIRVNYQLDGTTISMENHKIPATQSTLPLHESIVVDGIVYAVDTPSLTLGVETTYDVPLTTVGALGGGFVGTVDISSDGHAGTDQVATLVGKAITEMTVTNGISYDVDLKDALAEGQTVRWVSDDETVATVDQNGLIQAVGLGQTTITAVIYDADGNMVALNTLPITVLPAARAEAAALRKVALYNEIILFSTIWCIINGDVSNAFEVVNGELIYGYFEKSTGASSDPRTTTAFSFFGDPDEACALAAMTASNSFGDYYLLHDNNGDMAEGSDYYVTGSTSGAGYWQAVGLNNNSTANWDIVRNMVQWAIAHGCDGGQGFTRRQSEGDLCQNLTFISDPMPTIKKTVSGVLPTSRLQADFRRYTDGMTAAVRELVYFEIKIDLVRPVIFQEDGVTGAIIYTDAIVSDTILPGGYFYTKDLDREDGLYDGEIAPGKRVQIEDITEQLNATWAADEENRTIDLYLIYEIRETDIPKRYLDNIAHLEFGYESEYSKGSQLGAADAEARISVVGAYIDDVVIDFGQSVVYTGLTDLHLGGAYTGDQTKYTANYGTVEVDRAMLKDDDGLPLTDEQGNAVYGYTVRYTPTTILRSPDAVGLYGIGEDGTEKLINSFLVYPATTVYYEEGFLFENSDWDTSAAQKATMEQAFELLGRSQFNEDGEFTGYISDKKHPYGYDPIYAPFAMASGGSQAVATEVGAATSFGFTGTGFDLYANCTPQTGIVAVQVLDADGEAVRLYVVDTVVKGGSTAATTGQVGNEYHLPIVSEQGLPHGDYTLSIRKIGTDPKPVQIDGIRINNTVADSSIYTIDQEDEPQFYQLRDHVLHAVRIDDTTSKDYGTLAQMADQVFGQISTESETPVAILSNLGDIYTGTPSATAQDLLDNGPKNELFLYPGQTLTFSVRTSRAMQIGLKAPAAETAFSLKYRIGNVETPVQSTSILTSTDMFYALGNPIGTETDYTVTVTNTGADLLSVTDLKICDDPNAIFRPLNEEDIRCILTDAGWEAQPPQQEAPAPMEDLPQRKHFDWLLVIGPVVLLTIIVGAVVIFNKDLPM